MGRDGVEVVAGSGDHLALDGVQLVEQPQRNLDWLRLADRSADVGFQSVAEAAVGVLISTERLEHRFDAGVEEVVGKAQSIQQAGVQPDEIRRGAKVDLSHQRKLKGGCGCCTSKGSVSRNGASVGTYRCHHRGRSQYGHYGHALDHAGVAQMVVEHRSGGVHRVGERVGGCD